MTMLIGAKDRSYYRMEMNRDLIEQAQHNPTIELCIVLAERLQDATRKIEQLEWNKEKHD